MLRSEIFKANDIRGVVVGSHPEWDVVGANELGAAYVRLLSLSGKRFVLGRDMRHLGAELAGAFMAGARCQGASVIDIGLSSTDQLWFASGAKSLPGVQFTASHNPAEYNGIKFCLPGALPVPSGFLPELAELAKQDFDNVEPGGYESWDCLDEYARHLRSLVSVPEGRRLKIVVDAGNGMAGHTVAAAFAGLDVELIGLYLELDGRFPNHAPNPLVPQNLIDAQSAVIEHGADLALVFDGDADRCFIIDEQAQVIDPSIITAMIAVSQLQREPGATVVVNSITSDVVAQATREHGGKAVVSLVGHTYMKAKMAEHNAIFGGEHSAHYYFRDFWGADTGMLAALHVVAMLAGSPVSLSQLVARYDVLTRSGELNSVVADVRAVQESVAAAFAGRGEASWVDGLTVRADRWWFNLRPSNTEPLLRLNVEANDPATMEIVKEQVLALIKENA